MNSFRFRTLVSCASDAAMKPITPPSGYRVRSMQVHDEVTVEPFEVEPHVGQPFLPNWVSPPCDGVVERFQELKWSRKEAARQLGISMAWLQLFMMNRVRIDKDMAARLAKAFQVPTEFWLKLEENYQDGKKRLGMQ